MKTVIITGGGSGLGEELALLYAKKGFNVLIIGRTEETLLHVKNKITKLGGRADFLILDITNRNNVIEKVSNYCDGKDLYGLINNAGIGHFGPFMSLTDKQLHEMFSTNVFGTFYMIEAVLPFLEKQQYGHIINIISTAGLYGKVHETGYAASKFAVRGLTESLQQEYKNKPISISAVYMGGMDTPFWDNNNFVTDRSRLDSATKVANQIINKLPAEEIIIK